MRSRSWFQSAPALCRAGDNLLRESGSDTSSFNPRPLFAERATLQGFTVPFGSIVSIRARSLQSGRQFPRAFNMQVVKFQSAPALCRAGDHGQQNDDRACSCFNPRPLFAERATRYGPRPCRTPRVSIRARSLQSGRRPFARRTEARSRRFNPRPLFAERATRAWRTSDQSQHVSIRARSLQSGRPAIAASLIQLNPFQSAPALCRAGDVPRDWKPHQPAGFNPRPLFAERATAELLTKDGTGGVSIRARSLQSGRRLGWSSTAQWHPVSIRARSLQSGRLSTASNWTLRDLFQSAPALCRAGDCCSMTVQILSPSFNPRPLFAERATEAMATGAVTASVSIRARSLQSGRPSPASKTLACASFQSAPALCRAGDACDAQSWTGVGLFQSAPALCRAGDQQSTLRAPG